MAAFAVRDAIFQSNLEPGAIDLLACATTLPDLLVPGFASTVHGELSELSPLEIVSTQGVCCVGVSALNYAASQIELQKKNRHCRRFRISLAPVQKHQIRSRDFSASVKNPAFRYRISALDALQKCRSLLAPKPS
ncbi:MULTISPECIES: hypothetical protein [unclassified Microcoleus]|uniref:hypothetical protein n=1 Tax=unclassified Microcoleus TaxID=2642155 RepID=UPI002FCEC893